MSNSDFKWGCITLVVLAELPPNTSQGPSIRPPRPLRPTPTSSNGMDLDPPDFDSLTPPPPYTDVESKPGLDDNCGEDDVYYIPYHPSLQRCSTPTTVKQKMNL